MMMITKNHWKQLKHHHLGFMHQPQLDQTIYIMLTHLVPAIIITSNALEGIGCIGTAVQLTTYQQELKQAWKTLSEHSVVGGILVCYRACLHRGVLICEILRIEWGYTPE